MISVIIAGGSGSRLWPLSTPDYPKHLLNLTNDRSLLQNTVERAELVANDIYVISEASHIEHVYEQLPNISRDHILVEPGRRGTASCVIMALASIKTSHSADEPIVFMHADHHIRDTQGFVETVQRAAAASLQNQQIVLLGLEPTHPATGFGYIERGAGIKGDSTVHTVQSFKEKPDHHTAEHYLATGHYLWNMGYFVAPLAVFETSIKTYAPHLWNNYQALLGAADAEQQSARYLEFAGEPIDTALIEKVDQLLVTPGAFDWMDVGSFPDMHVVNSQDEDGNTLQGNIAVEHVTNSLVRNDTTVPVAVIGLDNVAVIATENGIMVTSKSFAQKVGDVSKRFER